MKKILALAILISLLGTNTAYAKSKLFSAKAEQSSAKYDKYNGKYNFKTDKIVPAKNKYDYINMSWWSQFNDEYLNDYIVRAV